MRYFSKTNFKACIAVTACLFSYPANAQNETRSSAQVTSQTLYDNFSKLRHNSCDNKKKRVPFSPLNIKVTAAPLGTPDTISQALPSGVTFYGGWHLTAQDSNFGGLSGLERIEGNHLLAVSDLGRFYKINMSMGIPTGEAETTPLSNSKGRLLKGKKKTDAEGLAVKDGLAFVSFERNHRVLAYDLKTCGAAAKGVVVTPLPKTFNGLDINPNSGAEALTFDSDQNLVAGYETVVKGVSPQILIGHNTAHKNILDGVKTPFDMKLVGLSEHAVLLRGYDPIRGNRNIIRYKDKEIRLAPPLNVDNFEGIAEHKISDSRTRLYIISDDNFSGRQRTLLYAFDIETKPRP